MWKTMEMLKGCESSLAEKGEAEKSKARWGSNAWKLEKSETELMKSLKSSSRQLVINCIYSS